MLTVTRTPLSLVTNTHYAMGGRDAADGRTKTTRRSARVADKENDESSTLLDDDFSFTTKNTKAAKGSSFDKIFASKKTNGVAAEASTVRTNNKTNAAKRKAAAYDEDDDGFTFTRANPKKAKTDDPIASSKPIARPTDPGLVAEETRDVDHTADKAATRTAARPGRRGQKRNAETQAAPAVTNEHEPEAGAERDPEPATEVELASRPAKRKGRPPKAQPKAQKSQTRASPGHDTEVPPLRVEKKRTRRQKSPPPAEEVRWEEDEEAAAAPTIPAEAPPEAPSEAPPARAQTPLGPGTTKIALPFADTPIIRKNQEMRRRASTAPLGANGDRSGRSSRRSSLGQRGRRASSLIDSGRSSALPHDAVDGAEFFKHIETALPEPRRMKQLLTWCATRALGHAKSKDKELENKKAGKARDRDKESQVRLAAREIQSQILKDFGLRPDMSNWFDRPEEAETGRETVLKKPNPRNEANEKKIKELEAQLARLQSERTTWESLLQPPTDKPLLAPLSTPSAPPSSTSGSNNKPGPSPSFANIDATLLSASNASILSSLRSLGVRTAPVLQEQARRRLDAATRDLEFDADRLAESAHVLGRYRRLGGRLADTVLDCASAALDMRARRERERSGTEEVGIRDVLRGLSRVENR